MFAIFLTASERTCARTSLRVLSTRNALCIARDFFSSLQFPRSWRVYVRIILHWRLTIVSKLAPRPALAKMSTRKGCTLAKVCTARLEALKLNVRVYVSRGKPAEARVFLDGDKIGCCYFTGAANSTVVAAPAAARLPFFKGVRARGGLFIQNERVGTLYLRLNVFDKL